MSPTHNPDSKVLLEIRDLLEVLADAAYPEFKAQTVRQYGPLVRGLINTEAQWQALDLMDGVRSQTEVSTITGADSGNFSRFISRLRAAGLVVDGTNGPKCVLGPYHRRALREAGDA